MWLRTLLAGAVAVALSGCSSEPITQTPFQRAAGDAGSIMSAAAYTLEFIQLAEQLDAAVDDLQNACLLPDCDWQGQVQRMREASDALAQAAE